MIYLFTDYGLNDWYVGQMRAVLARMAPAVPVIDLMHGVTPFDIQAGAYLLGTLAGQLPEASISVGVVDPGVGGTRRPLMMEADGRWFVGPDNGLLALVWRRAKSRRAYRIDWRPQSLSNSFHGRDLFAPAAAMLAAGQKPDATEISDPLLPSGWPDDLWRVIHVDRFGNAVTGIRGATVGDDALLEARGHKLAYAPTFSAGAPDTPFWYRNSINLVELAFLGASATACYGFAPGDPVKKAK
jgi:S-adenosylmethionine hydrolase